MTWAPPVASHADVEVPSGHPWRGEDLQDETAAAADRCAVNVNPACRVASVTPEPTTTALAPPEHLNAQAAMCSTAGGASRGNGRSNPPTCMACVFPSPSWRLFSYGCCCGYRGPFTMCPITLGACMHATFSCVDRVVFIRTCTLKAGVCRRAGRRPSGSATRAANGGDALCLPDREDC